jgi:nucleoside-diphosphate-sugar epimerase
MSEKIFLVGTDTSLTYSIIRALNQECYTTMVLCPTDTMTQRVMQAGGHPLEAKINNTTAYHEGIQGSRAVINAYLPYVLDVPAVPKQIRNQVNKKIQVNLNLLESSQACDDVPIIYVGDCSVYGNPNDKPIQEFSEYNPISFASDFAPAEVPILEAMLKQTSPIIVLRYAYMYSPEHWFMRVVGTSIREKKRLLVPTHAPRYFPMIHIWDVARFIRLLVNHLPIGNTFILADGIDLSFRERIVQLQSYFELPDAKNLGWINGRMRWGKRIWEYLHASYQVPMEFVLEQTGFTYAYPDFIAGIQSIVENTWLPD